MNLRGVIRWWPPVGLLTMALLGVVVGKGSTTIDDWFTRTGHDNPLLGRLLFFTDPRVLAVLLLGALLVATYRRRWRVAAVVAVTPVVLAAGAVAIALAWSVLAALGQAFTYHYFTDTVGAALLTTALLCLAAWAAQLDGCQPGCDGGHSSG
jgi:hypothetical protein